MGLYCGKMTADDEADRATLLLVGRKVVQVTRDDEHHLKVSFDDGSHLLVFSPAPLQLSIYHDED